MVQVHASSLMQNLCSSAVVPLMHKLVWETQGYLSSKCYDTQVLATPFLHSFFVQLCHAFQLYWFFHRRDRVNMLIHLCMPLWMLYRQSLWISVERYVVLWDLLAVVVERISEPYPYRHLTCSDRFGIWGSVNKSQWRTWYMCFLIIDG